VTSCTEQEARKETTDQKPFLLATPILWNTHVRQINLIMTMNLPNEIVKMSVETVTTLDVDVDLWMWMWMWIGLTD
jgi:hypothetical protein